MLSGIGPIQAQAPRRVAFCMGLAFRRLQARQISGYCLETSYGSEEHGTERHVVRWFPVHPHVGLIECFGETAHPEIALRSRAHIEISESRHWPVKTRSVPKQQPRSTNSEMQNTSIWPYTSHTCLYLCISASVFVSISMYTSTSISMSISISIST